MRHALCVFSSMNRAMRYAFSRHKPSHALLAILLGGLVVELLWIRSSENMQWKLK